MLRANAMEIPNWTWRTSTLFWHLPSTAVSPAVGAIATWLKSYSKSVWALALFNGSEFAGAKAGSLTESAGEISRGGVTHFGGNFSDGDIGVTE